MIRVCRLYKATDDVEALSLKHPGVWETQRNVERLIARKLTQGHFTIPGLKFRRSNAPAVIVKAKMIYPPLGGKNSGLRCVYERVTIDGVDYAVVLMSTLHQGGKSEQDNREVLRRRFLSFEATAAGLRDLDMTDTESYFVDELIEDL